MSRRRLMMSTVGLATVLVAATSTPALAYSQYSYNQTACGAILSGARIVVQNQLNNDDKGKYDEILNGSYARVRAYRCSDGASIKFSGRLTWSITATGWSIDSCGVSVYPASFGCSGGGSSQTIKDDFDFSSTYGFERVKSSTESLYFSDGSWGDTTKVCATVTAVVSGRGVSTTSCVSA
jgi:hypothetical protein